MAVDNKRIAKNTVALYIRMLLLMAVSLYTSRVILDVLGVDDYGIYNLIGGFVTLFSFISHALVGAMQRFFNVVLGINKTEQYKRLYSMSINIFAIFSLFLVVVGETVGLWFVTTQLNIPPGRETAALWVYQISLVTLIVNLLRTPNNASIIAHEKMSFYAYISIGEAVLKLAIVFMLQAFGHDKLIVYVLLYLASTILINVVYWFYCRKHIPLCRFLWMWDKNLCKQLVSFSGWNLLSGGSRVLKSQGDAYLLNHYYSVAVNAAFGIAAQVYNAVNMFLTNFQTAFRPQLVQTYAAGEMDEHYRLLYRSAKFSYYLLLLIVVPVAFNLNDLLGLWLKEVPEYTLQFCLILLMAYLVDAIGAPLATSVNAQGNIKGMQIWSSVLLLAGLVASFVFLRKGAKPWILAIITFAVHVGFMLVYIYYAHKLCYVKMRSFFRQVILPIAGASALSLVIPVVIRSLGNSGFWLVIGKCAADLAWVAVAVFLLGLAKEEKEYVKAVVLRIFKLKRSQQYDNQQITPPSHRS